MPLNAATYPAFMSLPRAAAYLDMTPRRFRELVAARALPGPVALERWDKEQIDAIMRGATAKPANEDVEI